MTSGWMFLAIGIVLAIGDLMFAQFAIRKTRERAALDGIESPSPNATRATAAMIRVGSVVIFLIFAALAFGLIPSASIQPIKLH